MKMSQIWPTAVFSVIQVKLLFVIIVIVVVDITSQSP